MAEQEKTALEIILELPSILKKIENKIDVLDTNLKILNSKLNKLKVDSQSTKPETFSENNSEKIAKENIEEVISRPMAVPGNSEKSGSSSPTRESGKLIIGSIKVFSRVKTSSGKPVDGMTINIFDKSNDLIRNLLTDKDGYWECKLPHGKYSIEMIHPKIKTINKEFELSREVKSYEVV
jgi:hypothetical protein